MTSCFPCFASFKQEQTPILHNESLECFSILARSDLGPLLGHQVLAHVARICEISQLPTGCSVYLEEESVQRLYLLLEGNVELYKSLPEGASSLGSLTSSVDPKAIDDETSSPQQLFAPRHSSAISPPVSPTHIVVQGRPSQPTRVRFRMLREGQWFGQCAALGLKQRQCSAYAKSRCRVLSLSWYALAELLITLGQDQTPIQVMLGVTVIRELRNVPFLRGLTRQQASLLSTLFHPRRLQANTSVFEEGERSKEGPSLFFCNSGTLMMHQSDQDRSQLLIRYIQSNEFFGEACMLFDLSRIATVRTVSDCSLSELPYSAFATFLTQFPSVSVDTTCAFNRQSIPTQHLLSNPTIMAAFAMFVAHEASMENVAFWMAARKFRVQATRNKQFLLQDARALYDTYISSNAAKQVNLKGTVQLTLQRAVQHECITKLTFEEAEQEILRLMDMDSFARFRLSKEFSMCLESCRRRPRKPVTDAVGEI